MESRKKITSEHVRSHLGCLVEFPPLRSFAYSTFNIRFCKSVLIILYHVTVNFTADPPTESVSETRHPPIFKNKPKLTAITPFIFLSHIVSLVFPPHHNYACCHPLSRNHGSPSTPCERRTLSDDSPKRMLQDVVFIRAPPGRGHKDFSESHRGTCETSQRG
jgi:hypothetical protein